MEPRTRNIIETDGKYTIRLMPSGKCYYIVYPDGETDGSWYFFIEKARQAIAWHREGEEELYLQNHDCYDSSLDDIAKYLVLS